MGRPLVFNLTWAETQSVRFNNDGTFDITIKAFRLQRNGEAKTQVIVKFRRLYSIGCLLQMYAGAANDWFRACRDEHAARRRRLQEATELMDGGEDGY